MTVMLVNMEMGLARSLPKKVNSMYPLQIVNGTAFMNLASRDMTFVRLTVRH